MPKKSAPKKTSSPVVSVQEPEPQVVESTSVESLESVENKGDCSPIEQQFLDILSDLNTQKQQITLQINKIRKLHKDWQKEQKLSNKKKKKSNGPAKKRDPSGFAKPTQISKDLCDFLGKSYGTEMARTEVTKYLTEYIRTNNLQFPKDKRKIIPDKKLQKLLGSSKEDEVTYFNLQKWMKPHFHKATPAPEVSK